MHFTRRSMLWRGVGTFAVVTMLGSGLAQVAATQQPPPNAPAGIPTYRPPSLALVQPAAGGSVPQDRPVLLFRFAPGDPSDPLDVRTFSVTADGQDRSALFQVTTGEAWGPIAPTGGDHPQLAAIGAHQIASRICSARGVCGEVTATVTVVASSAAAPAKPPDRKRTLIDLLLDAARKLLTPDAL